MKKGADMKPLTLRQFYNNALKGASPLGKRVYYAHKIQGKEFSLVARQFHLTMPQAEDLFSQTEEVLMEHLSLAIHATDIFDFNLIYCDSMVERVMQKIREIQL